MGKCRTNCTMQIANLINLKLNENTTNQPKKNGAENIQHYTKRPNEERGNSWDQETERESEERNEFKVEWGGHVLGTDPKT